MRTFPYYIMTALTITVAVCCLDRVVGFSVEPQKIHQQLQQQPQQQQLQPRSASSICHDRKAFLGIASTVQVLLLKNGDKAWARAPGSVNVAEAIQQIRDAKQDLQKLDASFSDYSVIDDEGRAGSTDGARRILGGIAPQAGMAAIEAAKRTPLYRVDVAFLTVRKAALGVLEDNSNEWADQLDLDRFEELAEKILYGIQKADGNFYSVLFAAKGTKMINDIFIETKSLIRQGIQDFDEMIGLLKDANAPGL